MRVVVKRVNVDAVYNKCLSGNPEDVITARTVYDYCISPFMVYCNKFGPEEKKGSGEAHLANEVYRMSEGRLR